MSVSAKTTKSCRKKNPMICVLGPLQAQKCSPKGPEKSSDDLCRAPQREVGRGLAVWEMGWRLLGPFLLVPPVPPFPRRLAAAVVSSLGLGRPGVVTPSGGWVRISSGRLRRTLLLLPRGFGGPRGPAAPSRRGGVLLPLGLGRCRCGSWRAADLASGRGVDMFFGVGAVRAAAVTNHIGTSMGTLRAWIPYFFPADESPVLEQCFVGHSHMWPFRAPWRPYSHKDQ